MKLSNKTIRKFFRGAIYFEEENGYLTPYRYSKKQLDRMNDESYDWGWRMRGKFSGTIRMELKTDAEAVSFDYRADCSHELSNTIDLYVNDVLTSVYKIGEKLKGRVELSLPQGKKKITIYFPCESKLEIKNFTLVNGGYEAIKPKRRKLLILGDSITQGAGTEISSSAYANVLSREIDYDILAQGIGGYRFEPCDLMKIDGFEPEKIIVFLGTNYYEKSCEERGFFYEKSVNEYYDKLSELFGDTPVIAITPLWRNNNVDFERLAWCTAKIKESCSKHKQITVVDGFELVPCVDECFSDKVHPNSYGATFLAQSIRKIIEKQK